MNFTLVCAFILNIAVAMSKHLTRHHNAEFVGASFFGMHGVEASFLEFIETSADDCVCEGDQNIVITEESYSKKKCKGESTPTKFTFTKSGVIENRLSKETKFRCSKWKMKQCSCKDALQAVFPHEAENKCISGAGTSSKIIKCKKVAASTTTTHKTITTSTSRSKPSGNSTTTKRHRSTTTTKGTTTTSKSTTKTHKTITTSTSKSTTTTEKHRSTTSTKPTTTTQKKVSTTNPGKCACQGDNSIVITEQKYFKPKCEGLCSYTTFTFNRSGVFNNTILNKEKIPCWKLKMKQCSCKDALQAIFPHEAENKCISHLGSSKIFRCKKVAASTTTTHTTITTSTSRSKPSGNSTTTKRHRSTTTTKGTISTSKSTT